MRNRAFLLILSLLVLFAPSPSDALASALPAAVDTTVREEEKPAALYFRYWDEPYLACEWRTIARTASESYEHAVMAALLQGPSAASTELNGLFPVGTRILSVVRQGRTLFVTFSSEIMNLYTDEPDTWQSLDAWRTEVPLRRTLCMQSVVATATENCDVDRVQVLVEQKDSVTESLRLRQGYFLDGTDPTALVGPMERDDSLILACGNAMDRMLRLIIARDWDRLYRSLAPYDTRTAVTRPIYEDFLSQMEALPALTDYAASSPTLSLDGQDATVQVFGTVTLPSLRTVELPARIFHLTRVDGLWKVSLSQFTEWMEVQ